MALQPQPVATPSRPATARSHADNAEPQQSGLEPFTRHDAPDRNNFSPPSDDSISAYINHHTSSPADAHLPHQAHQKQLRRVEGAADQEQTPSSQEGSKSHRLPSSPSPTPADEEDVAAASGMLRLRASQDLSAADRRPVASAWSHRARAMADGGRASSPAFLIHQDGPTMAQVEPNAPLHAGAFHDRALFEPSASQTSMSALMGSKSETSVEAAHVEPHIAAEDVRDADGSGGDDDDEDDGGVVYDASQTTFSSFDSQCEKGQDDGPNGKAKKRRRRTKKEEADVLVNSYAHSAFPDAETRQRLAHRLGMTTRAVSIWFQNRRQAERKRATRFGPLHPSHTGPLETSQGPSPTPPSVSTGSAHLSSVSAKLQRWPSLDAIAAHQRVSLHRDSPSSEDEDRVPLRPSGQPISKVHTLEVEANAGQQPPSAASTSRPGPESLTVFEDKENIPPATTASPLPPRSSMPRSMSLDQRQPLRDLRDLVSGKDSLNETEAEPLFPNGRQAPADQQDENAALPLGPSAGRTPFGRSFSTSAVAKPRVSMDHIVSRLASKRPPGSPRRSAGAGLLRLMSLCTSKRGRASLDGKPSPPRKRPFARSLSLSSHLPPSLAKAIEDQREADEQQKAREGHAKDLQGLLGKMSSSSSGSSEEAMAQLGSSRSRLLDEGEDEERTLRMAANRRLARAQMQGRSEPDRADARNGLMHARPWARSISGPATQIGFPTGTGQSRIAAPTLEMAAGRDRSKPNPMHGLELRSTVPASLLKSLKGNEPPNVSSTSSSSSATAPAHVEVTKRTKKRKTKDGEGSQRKKPSNAATRSQQDEDAACERRQDGRPAPVHSTPRASKQNFPTASTPSGLPSFGTPRDGLPASGRRSFGRSMSAQYVGASGAQQSQPAAGAFGGDDASLSLLGRPMLPGLYSNTPAPPRRSTSGAMSSVVASNSREMTPRSLAFALGLTHNTPAGFAHQQTPYSSAFGSTGMGAGVGMGMTPFGSTSRYSSSRHVPPSTGPRTHYDGSMTGGGERTAPYSPLARGREGAMLAPMTTSSSMSSVSVPASAGASAQKRKSPDDDSNSGGSSEGTGGSHGSNNSNPGARVPFSASRGRVPFSKVNSQPSLPPPPMFATPSHPASAAHGQGRGSTPAQRPRLPSLSSLASASANKENVAPAQRRSPRKEATVAQPNKRAAEVVGDDSGYVPPSDDDDDDGDGDGATEETKMLKAPAGPPAGRGQSRKGPLVESPTRVQQQRQRQHDAAQVLLGLAGEGR